MQALLSGWTKVLPASVDSAEAGGFAGGGFAGGAAGGGAGGGADGGNGGAGGGLPPSNWTQLPRSSVRSAPRKAASTLAMLMAPAWRGLGWWTWPRRRDRLSHSSSRGSTQHATR